MLPAVLALAGQRGASGAEMLAAYIAGSRPARASPSAMQGGLHAHGFHPTGVVGAFASALAAGRLLGLDDAGAASHAQGIALSMASGSLQFIEDGAWTKRMHPGWAAQAASPPRRSPPTASRRRSAPYEGRYGFYRCYLGEAEHERIDLSLATAGLRPTARQRCGRSRTSRSSRSRCATSCMPAPTRRSRCTAQASTPRASARSRCSCRRASCKSVCEPVANKRRPTSDYDAKFSLPYAVASGLLRGRLGLKELDARGLRRPGGAAR